jgi:signal transduction histidine kinase
VHGLHGGLRRLVTSAWTLPVVLVFASAALVATPEQVGISVPTEPFRRTDAVTVALALGQGIPLGWRRRWPVPVLAAVLLAYVLDDAFDCPPVPANLAVLVALHAAAANAVGTHRRVAGAVVLLGAAADAAALRHAGVDLRPFDLLMYFGFFAVFWIGGLWSRTRAAYVRQVEERATLLEQMQEVRAREAATRERVRIARDLHDLVSHNVTVMVLQADAGIATGQDRPAAEATLRAVGDTGRRTLAELRRLLGVLRGPDDEPDGGPGLDRLDELVERVTGAGLPVEVRLAGDARPLFPAVDTAGYRIVQESLTNLLKHGDRGPARVLLGYLAHSVELEISGEGGTRPPVPDGNGYGLAGMRERVTLVGGRLDTYRDGEGRFVVRATLPAGGRPA